MILFLLLLRMKSPACCFKESHYFFYSHYSFFFNILSASTFRVFLKLHANSGRGPETQLRWQGELGLDDI